MKIKDLIIIKLGGSVITQKKSNLKKINRKKLERLSGEIASALRKRKFSLIIVHGVGTFGHVIAKKFHLKDGYKSESQIKAVSQLRCDLEKLNYEVIKSLRDKGVNCVDIHPSSFMKFENGEVEYINTTVIRKNIELGFVPVLHGDILIDEYKGFGIISGDGIICELSKALCPSKIIMGTDIDGVFDSDPKVRKNAKLIREINNKTIKNISIGESTAIDVTGGMKGKIKELIKLADCGAEIYIINILKPGILEKCLLGQKVLGTTINIKSEKK